MTERLSKGAAGHIRKLKEGGRTEEAEEFRRAAVKKGFDRVNAVDNHLASLGLETRVGDLDTQSQEAIKEWYELRRNRQTSMIDEETFDTQRKEFSTKHDALLDSKIVKIAITFITNRTQTEKSNHR